MEVSELLRQHPSRHPFQRCYERGERDLRRVVHQLMDVVVPAVKFHQPGFEFLAHIREDGLHRLKVLLAEYNALISGHEDQMHMQREYAVPPVTQVGVGFSWRTLHFPCRWF
jgi:hypothetical protein